MNRLIIASNRLPVSIQWQENNFQVFPSAGGLATGLKSYHKNNNSLWIGWPGINAGNTDEEKTITDLLLKEACLPVFLSQDLVENFYDGFSNATLWPLLHYFTEYTEFKGVYWDAYQTVNQLFADAIIANAQEGDTIWVHDYQLLLVPQMIKAQRPDLRIGFFLHIPFPSFEVFRILPWRLEIVNGILGADLIGFHTFDYARHFISSVKRLLGYEVDFNKISVGNRHVYIDVFPMGIDYKKFEQRAVEIQNKPMHERSKEHQDIDRFLLGAPNRKLILSIDRLDYTKGIPERLHAFRNFLNKYPEYKEQVSLIMLTVPSRVDVEQYQNLRSEVEKLVGSINGEFGTINWNPVIYFYRSLPFVNLIELYSSADIALLTPLRDGMNLVAKEYIASKVNHRGVLILSEMAGAAKELGEALIVNPNNVDEVSDAIYKALTMSYQEQVKAITTMQERITRYNVYKWAADFIEMLEKTESRQAAYQARKVSQKHKNKFKNLFADAKSKILFLDYDGTLQRFYNNPKDAIPDKDLVSLLNELSLIKNTELVLISGRDKDTLNEWFGKKDYTLIAEHGAWIKSGNTGWKARNTSHSKWKENIRPVLESYVDRTPGSLIEEKTNSLVWHYRKADIELGALRALELKNDVTNLISNQDLELLEGSKVLEVKVAGINKGNAALEYLQDKKPEFLMAIGDDWTDEFLFKELPDETITIKVGTDKSVAKYYVSDYQEVRELLKTFN
ncbi:MAG: bifunctional alpha,alpha-trehalose-phosphate synthase (UDP-forming)/trehalose-phosphatase [Salinivirgaceae bacterium]